MNNEQIFSSLFPPVDLPIPPFPPEIRCLKPSDMHVTPSVYMEKNN